MPTNHDPRTKNTNNSKIEKPEIPIILGDKPEIPIILGTPTRNSNNPGDTDQNLRNFRSATRNYWSGTFGEHPEPLGIIGFPDFSRPSGRPGTFGGRPGTFTGNSRGPRPETTRNPGGAGGAPGVSGIRGFPVGVTI